MILFCRTLYVKHWRIQAWADQAATPPPSHWPKVWAGRGCAKHILVYIVSFKSLTSAPHLYENGQKIFSCRGLRPLNPHQGLCPWTPLGPPLITCSYTHKNPKRHLIAFNYCKSDIIFCATTQWFLHIQKSLQNMMRSSFFVLPSDPRYRLALAVVRSPPSANPRSAPDVKTSQNWGMCKVAGYQMSETGHNWNSETMNCPIHPFYTCQLHAFFPRQTTLLRRRRGKVSPHKTASATTTECFVSRKLASTQAVRTSAEEVHVLFFVVRRNCNSK